MKRIIFIKIFSLIFLGLSPLLFTSRAMAISAYVTQKNFGNDVIYYLLTDRFNNGYSLNDVPRLAFPADNEYDLWHRERMPYMYDGSGRVLSLIQGGDIQGIIDKLSYLQDLSVTMLLITPVIDNTNGFYYADFMMAPYHGYWANDWYRLDEHVSNGYSEFLRDDFFALRMKLKDFAANEDVLVEIRNNLQKRLRSKHIDQQLEAITYLMRIDRVLFNSYYKILTAEDVFKDLAKKYRQSLNDKSDEVKLQAMARLLGDNSQRRFIQPLLRVLEQTEALKDRLKENIEHCLAETDDKQQLVNLSLLVEYSDSLFLFYLQEVITALKDNDNSEIINRLQQIKEIKGDLSLTELTKDQIDNLRRRFLDLSDDYLIYRFTATAAEYGIKVLFDMPLNNGPTGLDINWDGQQDTEYLQRQQIFIDRKILTNEKGENIGQKDNSNWPHSLSEIWNRAGYIDNSRYQPERVIKEGELHWLPDLNQHNPIVKKYLLNAINKWQRLGVRGFRLDSAKYVFEDFISQLEESVLKIDPGAVLIAEYFGGGIFDRKSLMSIKKVGDYSKEWLKKKEGYSAIIGSGTVVTQFDFSFANAVRNFFAGTYDAHGRVSQIRGLSNLSPTVTARNWRELIDEEELKEMITFLENHDMRAMRSQFKEEKLSTEAYNSAVKYMYLHRGIPMIYYGQEQDAYLRHKIMPGSAGIQEFDFYRLLLEWPEDLSKRSTFNTYRLLGKLRQENLALRYGNEKLLKIKEITKRNTSIAFERKYVGKEKTYHAFYAYSKDGGTLNICLEDFPLGSYRDPLTGKVYRIFHDPHLFSSCARLLRHNFSADQAIVLSLIRDN